MIAVKWIINFLMATAGVIFAAEYLVDEPTSENDWTSYIAEKHLNVPADKIDVQLFDRSRVDMLYGDYSVEVDWSHKWSEGVGQALFYSKMTELKPMLLIISKDSTTEANLRYHLRARIACNAGGVKLLIYDCKRRKFVQPAKTGL